jgi:hypothetical protein
MDICFQCLVNKTWATEMAAFLQPVISLTPVLWIPWHSGREGSVQEAQGEWPWRAH